MSQNSPQLQLDDTAQLEQESLALMRPGVDFRGKLLSVQRSADLTLFSLCPYGHRQCSLEPPESIRCRHCRHILLVRTQPLDDSTVVSADHQSLASNVKERLREVFSENWSTSTAQSSRRARNYVPSKTISLAYPRVRPDAHKHTFPPVMPIPFQTGVARVGNPRRPPPPPFGPLARNAIFDQRDSDQMNQPVETAAPVPESRSILSIRRAPRTPERPGSMKAPLSSHRNSSRTSLESKECPLQVAVLESEGRHIAENPNQTNIIDTPSISISSRNHRLRDNHSNTGSSLQVNQHTDRVVSMKYSNSQRSIYPSMFHQKYEKSHVNSTNATMELAAYVNAPIHLNLGRDGSFSCRSNKSIDAREVQNQHRESSSVSFQLRETKIGSARSAKTRISDKYEYMHRCDMGLTDTSSLDPSIPQNNSFRSDTKNSDFDGLNIPLWNPDASIGMQPGQSSYKNSSRSCWSANESLNIKAITFPEELTEAPPFLRQRLSHLSSLVARTEQLEREALAKRAKQRPRTHKRLFEKLPV